MWSFGESWLNSSVNATALSWFWHLHLARRRGNGTGFPDRNLALVEAANLRRAPRKVRRDLADFGLLSLERKLCRYRSLCFSHYPHEHLILRILRQNQPCPIARQGRRTGKRATKTRKQQWTCCSKRPLPLIQVSVSKKKKKNPHAADPCRCSLSISIVSISLRKCFRLVYNFRRGVQLLRNSWHSSFHRYLRSHWRSGVGLARSLQTRRLQSRPCGEIRPTGRPPRDSQSPRKLEVVPEQANSSTQRRYTGERR